MIGRLPDVFGRQGTKLRLAGAVDVVVPLSAQSVPSSPFVVSTLCVDSPG
jgi:hypothetical protein